MKILTYLLSLVLGGFVYLLFASYMSVSAGASSSRPLISAGLAILIFSFLSWFHFYKPKIGAIALTVAIVVMYFSWPVFLLLEYFGDESFKPSPIEFLTPLALGGLVIFLVWKSRKEELTKWTKLILAILPGLVGVYFVVFYARLFIG